MIRPGVNGLAYRVEDAEALGVGWRLDAACRRWATAAGDIDRQGNTVYGHVVGGCSPRGVATERRKAAS